MICDKRYTFSTDDPDFIKLTADVDIEYGSWRAQKNARARYLRLIRKMSGLKYVNTHMMEHNPCFNDGLQSIVFGRDY